MLIPLSDAAKQKGDVFAVTGAALAYFNAIPWANLAAAAAFIYTILRIAELIASWLKKKK